SRRPNANSLRSECDGCMAGSDHGPREFDPNRVTYRLTNVGQPSACRMICSSLEHEKEEELRWSRTQSATNVESEPTGRRFRICRLRPIIGPTKIDNAKSKPWRMNGARSKKQPGRN